VAHLRRFSVTYIKTYFLIFFISYSSELAGGTPQTVQCNIHKNLPFYNLIPTHLNWWVAHLRQFSVTYIKTYHFIISYPSELAGGTPQTVQCNIHKNLPFYNLIPTHLNWRVAHLRQFSVTYIKTYHFIISSPSELAGGTPHTVQCNILKSSLLFSRVFPKRMGFMESII